MPTRLARPPLVASILLSLVIGGCAPSNDPETAASPVEGATRSGETLRGQFGESYNRRGDDGTVVAKVLAPAPAIWEALLATMAARKVTLTIIDRPAGRMGDTALVIMRRWNGQAMSFYMHCGSTMTGQRADEDRLRAVLLAQISRLRADTVGIAVHFSAIATHTTGNTSTQAQCVSNGRAESEFLDETIRRLGLAKG
ncbi:MAG: hypothetical protein JWL61_3486 [Gemmatimonadetes bacterium]|jgi:hypothetical protein|nr:hypothetical protein [Gemmatimonadota bacterium]